MGGRQPVEQESGAERDRASASGATPAVALAGDRPSLRVAMPGWAGMTYQLARAMRPHQWTKNAIVLAALVFDRKFFDLVPVGHAVMAFVAFCLVSSATYLVNDIRDVANDRAHPRKRLRPIASGLLPVPVAWVAAGGLILAALGIAWLVRPEFAGVIALYLALMTSYNVGLKQVAILDVMMIGCGFVLRAAGGAVAIGVPISPWLYVCTALLAVFLGFAKRRAELATLGADAVSHRPNLQAYTLPMLDQMIGVVAGATVMAYAFYTFEASSVPQDYSMMLTIPFVFFAVFRYLFLIHHNQLVGTPELLLFRDRQLFTAIVGWGVAVIVVLYYLA